MGLSRWSLSHPIGFIALREHNIFDGPYERVIDAKKVDGNFKLKVGTEARQVSRRPRDEEAPIRQLPKSH